MLIYYNINLETRAYPAHSPMIPATPAKTGGAGTGSLNKANTIPAPAPVKIDKIISFMIPRLVDMQPAFDRLLQCLRYRQRP